MSADRALNLLVQAARVSPPLRDATIKVGAELLTLRAEKKRLTEALRLACSDGWSDTDGAMDFYLRKVGSRWPELDRVSE